MSKLLVVVELKKRDLQDFEVILEIKEDSVSQTNPIKGTLPPAPEVFTHYRSWNSTYRSLPKSIRFGKPQPRTESKEARAFEELVEECSNSANTFSNTLKVWYNSKEFGSIKQRLQDLDKFKETRLLIKTKDSELWRLPWHLFFDKFLEYREAEVAMCPSESEQPPRAVPPISKPQVRILAILGNSTGVNVEEDRKLLEQLPDAKTSFLVERSRKEINKQLWDDKGWDILFFAGHSRTEGNIGQIYINETEFLTIEELKYALREAIKRGLRLAIFNSCDGLGLAMQLAELHIPQVIVMREPVPDQVAQEFLKYFIEAFSRGKKSLYLAMREAREKLHGLETEFPCASWLPVICQNPAEVPPTWQELRGTWGKVREFLPNGFELLDQSFFNIQGQLEAPKLLKLRRASWSFIIQGNYIERDQQGDALALAENLAKFEGISLLLIRGEPGAGKTSLMLWLAYELFRKGHLVLDKNTLDENLDWLDQLRKFSELWGEHFYVIADDIFRDESILDALERYQYRFPFTLIGTTRLNEDQHTDIEYLNYKIELLDVIPPSLEEKERVLDKIRQDDSEAKAWLDEMTPVEIDQLMDAPIMLVLMLQLLDGKPFAQIIADVIKNLPSPSKQKNESPIYEVFGVICSFFQYEIGIPPEVVPLCLHPDIRDIARNIVEEAGLFQLEGLAEVLIASKSKTYILLTTIHQLIAQVAVELDYRPRNNQNPPYSPRALKSHLITAFKNLDTTQKNQKRWATEVLNKLASLKEFELISEVLKECNNQVESLQQGLDVTAWFYWQKTYKDLGLLKEQNRCLKALISTKPKLPSEWDYWMFTTEKFGDKKEILDAINQVVVWLKYNPDAYVFNCYLALVERRGTETQKQNAINHAITWLQNNSDSYVRDRYLTFIANQGTSEQKQSVVSDALNWLEREDSNDTNIRVKYLDIIDKYGTLKQKQKVIKKTATWLRKHTYEQQVRAKYLALVWKVGQNNVDMQSIISEQWQWISHQRIVHIPVWAVFLPVVYHHAINQPNFIKEVVNYALKQHKNSKNLISQIFGYFRDYLEYDVCYRLANFIYVLLIENRLPPLPYEKWQNFIHAANFFRDNNEFCKAQEIYEIIIEVCQVITGDNGFQIYPLSNIHKITKTFNFASLSYARLLLMHNPPELDKAIEYLKPLLAENPKHSSYNWVMAQCYQAKGLYSQAIDSFQTAIQFDREQPSHFLYDFGCFYRDALKNRTEARACFETYLNGRNSFLAYLDLTELEIEDGNFEQARELLQQGLALVPITRPEREEREKLEPRIQELQQTIQAHLGS